MNEKNIEKQLTRIADNLESLVSVAKRAESLAQAIVAEWKIEKNKQEAGR